MEVKWVANSEHYLKNHYSINITSKSAQKSQKHLCLYSSHPNKPLQSDSLSTLVIMNSKC